MRAALSAIRRAKWTTPGAGRL
uniref:Uncharacterized protein n=1 Tax=Anguilla anguilla TaxID=7936 RepID=A0A0E9VZW4_ANGAN